MSKIVLLDSGPLGLATNPRAAFEARRCTQWMQSLVGQGLDVAIPEIADYEVRRELLRGGKTAGIRRLDALKALSHYAPITTEAMLLAAEYWARVRRQGRPTADDRALDGDVILAAQATILAQQGDEVVIATTNVRHLSLFAEAREWQDIT